MKIRSLLLGSLVLALVAMPVQVTFAKSKASTASSPAAADAKVTHYPAHGKLKAVDVSGMTFTIESANPKTFIVTSTTKIMKNGAPATLKDAVVGEDVGAYIEKGADGKLTAISVRFGPKPGATPKPAKAAATPAPTAAAAAAGTTPEATATPKPKKTRKAKASPSPSATP